jgi:hypothetical protein
VFLLFGGELNNGHCGALFPAEKKGGSIFQTKFVSVGKLCCKHFFYTVTSLKS